MSARPTVSETERRRRWRLLLGSAVDEVWTGADVDSDADADATVGHAGAAPVQVCPVQVCPVQVCAGTIAVSMRRSARCTTVASRVLAARVVPGD